MKKRKNRSDSKINMCKSRYTHEIFEFLFLFCAVMLRYVYCGIKYYPQLDDYIQYHLYKATLGFSECIKGVGLLGARPLAGIFDYAVWSLFWGKLIIAVILITGMLCVSAMLLKQVFKKYFDCGWIFLITVCLLPSNFEAVWWISASSRIVVGLFFASLSLYFIQKFFESGKKKYAVLYAVFQLISFGFYEQVIVFSVAVTVIIAVFNCKKQIRRALFSLFSLANMGIYFGITSFFSENSVYSSRSELILPASPYYFKIFLPEVLSQIKQALFSATVKIMCYGSANGVKRIISDKAFLYVICIAVITVLFIILRKFENREKHKGRIKWYARLIAALLITAAPMAPFFVVGNTWFSLRCAFLSTIGLSLIFEMIFDAVFGQLKSKNTVYTVLCSLVIVFSLVASVSEICDYKVTYEADNTLLSECFETFGEEQKNLDICILNVNISYAEDRNYMYHEHIHGVTESAWAMEGAYKSLLYDGYRKKSGEVHSLVPISFENKVLYKQWNYDSYHISRFDYIYFYDNEKHELLPVEIKHGANENYTLYFENGEEFAEIYEVDNIGYIVLK